MRSFQSVSVISAVSERALPPLRGTWGFGPNPGPLKISQSIADIGYLNGENIFSLTTPITLTEISEISDCGTAQACFDLGYSAKLDKTCHSAPKLVFAANYAHTRALARGGEP